MANAKTKTNGHQTAQRTGDKPVVGLNGEFRGVRKDVPSLSWINTGYYDSVTLGGGVPMVLPPLEDDDDLRQLFEQLDGLVLTGCGMDLDPLRMGRDMHPSVRVMPSRREDFDRRLCLLAIEAKLPVLAIGAGMQLMNVICGGTLFRHLPEECPRAIQHRDAVEANLRHVLDIVPGTRMDAIYGPGEIRVNSQHHMAIDQVASPFKVSATCPDGVVEAFESIDEDWCCLGVQWHPEAEGASALDRQVFDHFVESAAAYREARTPLRISDRDTFGGAGHAAAAASNAPAPRLKVAG